MKKLTQKILDVLPDEGTVNDTLDALQEARDRLLACNAVHQSREGTYPPKPKKQSARALYGQTK